MILWALGIGVVGILAGFAFYWWADYELKKSFKEEDREKAHHLDHLSKINKRTPKN